jgi:uncharacterized repeat protein (TIGR01451 family)
MKKLIILLGIIFAQLTPTQAQWVTIPDTNFVSKLQQLFPSCMNGNLMDTTCAGIVNATTLWVRNSNINNLSGLEYFVNLNNLNCNKNQLTNLPPLPINLNVLSCDSNQLLNLPTLPFSLTNLECRINQLNTFPVLPNNLLELKCNNNPLGSIPTLPGSLTTLICNNNLLNSLPNLPSSLTTLTCNNNQLSSLPPLPNSLTNLICNNNQLSSLPALPNSLAILWCHNNQLSSLPVMPISLVELICANNSLLTSLPTLPLNYQMGLDCSNCNLMSLPQLPDTMVYLNFSNNNIVCIEKLPKVLIPFILTNISNNPLTCVPNLTNYSGNLPLCFDNDPVNNPNNCPGVNIFGRVYGDMNGNCAYNPNDLHISNIPVKLIDSQNNLLAQSFTVNGVYSFANLAPDAYTVEIDTLNLPVSMACGQNNTQTATLNSTSQTLPNIDFPVVCSAPYDVWVQSVTPTGWVFPGQVHTMNTSITNNLNWFNLQCDTTTYSGTVTIQVNGPVSFVAPAQGALTPVVNGNTFTYSISDLATVTPNSFGLRFMTDTTAQANDQICVNVQILPTLLDANIANNTYNFCYNVVNSYDPNMKTVYPVDVLPGYDDWFTYTIYFQNTGNAPAFNIRLRDTLDANLDLSTFEILGYSHPAITTLHGNILTVRYNNIMLPDSTSDFEGSIGYFQYRIKSVSNLPAGTQIQNTAYIYFDFNAPIITNTTENNFDITVGATAIKPKQESYIIYPNPSTGIFLIKDNSNIQSIEVFNMMGERLLNQGKSNQINLSSYPKGIYFARINGQFVSKLVKE